MYLQAGLRRRFGLALQWFNVVRDRSQVVLQEWLASVRTYIKAVENTSATDVVVDEDMTSSQTRPSEYLRQRCAMCFGGDWSTPNDGFVFLFFKTFIRY
jgi:hypothetical protein